MIMSDDSDTSRGAGVSESRVQASLLSGVEKAALHWLAHRLPRWLGPDLLTFIGFAAMIGAGVSYYMAGRAPVERWLYLVLASVALVANWFGDSLDGTVARVRRMQRPMYGYYLDHLVDAFGTSFVLLGLAWSGLVDARLGVVLLALYMIASINAYLATHALGVFRISFGPISPTEGRVLLIVLNTVLIFWTSVPIAGRQVRILDILYSLGGLVLLVVILRSAIPNLVQLDRKERAQWKAEEDAGPRAE